MQLCGALFTEVLNLANIFGQQSSKGIITELIAFGVIAEVDDYFARMIQSPLKKEAFSKDTVFAVQDDLEHWEEMTAAKCFYKACKIMYKCVYYYFLPFVSLIFCAYHI